MKPGPLGQMWPGYWMRSSWRRMTFRRLYEKRRGGKFDEPNPKAVLETTAALGKNKGGAPLRSERRPDGTVCRRLTALQGSCSLHGEVR